MEDIVVGTYGDKTIFLKNVARIEDSVKERAQEAYNNGLQGGMVIIQKQSGANSVNISNAVLKRLPAIQKDLPSDVKLDIIINTSTNIENTIGSLVETVAVTFVIVMLVVFVFLGRWRATFIIVITIPISLIASFAYLLISGNTLNIISLSSLSIAIGMVVDDAIVVLENVTNHIERGSAPKQAAIHGTNEVAISVIASTLTMLAVFLPLTMITGMAGVFLFNMTMPLCLKQMHRQFPQHAGFAFGFLTFALFLGFVPVILGITAVTKVQTLILIALSWLDLRLAFHWGRNNA